MQLIILSTSTQRNYLFPLTFSSTNASTPSHSECVGIGMSLRSYIEADHAFNLSTYYSCDGLYLYTVEKCISMHGEQFTRGRHWLDTSPELPLIEQQQHIMESSAGDEERITSATLLGSPPQYLMQRAIGSLSARSLYDNHACRLLGNNAWKEYLPW